MRGGANKRSGAVAGDLLRLFGGDSVAGLGDGELLGRFVDLGDQGAFETLVSRLGPMVLGVCRRMLGDPHDSDDAFQATFLVLVRRARSIRDRDLVGAWLHGVATRVAHRARVQANRRVARERSSVVVEAREGEGLGSEWSELRALIDEEIGRLPEHHRRPVVLCDVEGLSREEAAERLGWSLNMVRGRLERARGRLRGRLARRGLVPSGGWAALLVAPPVPSSAEVAATCRAALAFSGGGVNSSLASASAVALSRGVLRMMMLSKVKTVALVLISVGCVAGGSTMIVAQGPGPGDPKPGVLVKEVDGLLVEAQAARRLAEVGKSRVEMARKRFETQKKTYEEGRITIDRLVAASETLMNAEVDVAETLEARLAPVQVHLARIIEIERREKAELEVGRATEADVEEIQTQRLDTEFRLAKAASMTRPGASTVADLERRITEVERKLDRVLNLLDAQTTPRPRR